LCVCVFVWVNFLVVYYFFECENMCVWCVCVKVQIVSVRECEMCAPWERYTHRKTKTIKSNIHIHTHTHTHTHIQTSDCVSTAILESVASLLPLKRAIPFEKKDSEILTLLLLLLLLLLLYYYYYYYYYYYLLYESKNC